MSIMVSANRLGFDTNSTTPAPDNPATSTAAKYSNTATFQVEATQELLMYRGLGRLGRSVRRVEEYSSEVQQPHWL
jgi:hypothetical protein